MTLETYKVTLKHDNGTKRLTISPFTSEESAIIAVMAGDFAEIDHPVSV